MLCVILRARATLEPLRPGPGPADSLLAMIRRDLVCVWRLKCKDGGDKGVGDVEDGSATRGG
jgi:hypothetical protein